MAIVKGAFCLFCFIGFWEETKAQTEEPLESDWFGVSYAPYTAKKNKLNGEIWALFTYTKDEESSERNLDLPSFALRFGLADRVELQLLSTYSFANRKWDSGTSEKENGLSDLQAAVKYNFIRHERHLPDAAIIFMYDYDGFDWNGGDTVNQSQIRLAFQNNFSEKIYLKYNIARNWDWDPHYYWSSDNYYFLSLSPGWNISTDLSLVIDGYVYLRKKKPEHEFFISSDLSYCINNYSDIDLIFEKRLNGERFWNLGLSYTVSF